MKFIQRIRRKTRAARFNVFKSFVAKVRTGQDKSDDVLRVLDIGGTVAFWEEWWKITEQDRLHLTLINDHRIDTTQKHGQGRLGLVDNVQKDATTLTLEELRAYDIIFANSFLEHLGSREQQKELAHKICSSGVPYFIQVPNKASPVDPHHPFAPFFALYPFPLRWRLLRISAFGPSNRAKSFENAREWQTHYNPLGLRDMRSMFPSASFKVERPWGVPMSILAAQVSLSKARLQ